MQFIVFEAKGKEAIERLPHDIGEWEKLVCFPNIKRRSEALSITGDENPEPYMVMVIQYDHEGKYF